MWVWKLQGCFLLLILCLISFDLASDLSWLFCSLSLSLCPLRVTRIIQSLHLCPCCLPLLSWILGKYFRNMMDNVAGTCLEPFCQRRYYSILRVRARLCLNQNWVVSLQASSSSQLSSWKSYLLLGACCVISVGYFSICFSFACLTFVATICLIVPFCSRRPSVHMPLSLAIAFQMLRAWYLVCRDAWCHPFIQAWLPVVLLSSCSCRRWQPCCACGGWLVAPLHTSM